MQKVLLDTQALIWLAREPQKLSPSAMTYLKFANELLLSYASVWEMAIKVKTGKMQLGLPLEEFIETNVEKHVLKLLLITLPHIYHTQQLPLHHRGPFDRLLIAQSITENIPVVSSDAAWDAYGVNRIWS